MVDEVVITVPYGTAKKSTFTGSASYIPPALLKKHRSVVCQKHCKEL